jgi:hypothetical protein
MCHDATWRCLPRDSAPTPSCPHLKLCERSYHHLHTGAWRRHTARLALLLLGRLTACMPHANQLICADQSSVLHQTAPSTDTPLDPHSPYEGFWWSHMGWFANSKVSVHIAEKRKDAAAVLFATARCGTPEIPGCVHCKADALRRQAGQRSWAS